uniref:DUF4382 domain-containing protein n=1 Tax=mine drainage metagenome TaxID=410659 RepID=E6PWR3_9ZZZZ
MTQLRFSQTSLAPCLLLFAALALAGCGSSSINSATSANKPTGASFVTGTDAPMAAVTSFSVVVNSIAATDASGNSVQLLSGSPTVDFARFNGLNTLLDMNDVAAGTYTSVTISLGNATIGYLNTTSGGAPTVVSEPATLTTSSVTVPLANPLVVSTTGAPVGLHVDFKLSKSIQVDSNGQITGMVNPTFTVDAVANTDVKAHIDEFTAAVVSVNVNAQSFVIQRPDGHQFTVNVNGQTEWDGNSSLSQLTSSSIVQISGQIDKASSTLNADEVDVLSQQGFFASGQITYVSPASGPATSFDLYVRGLLPATTGLTLGQIAQVDLSGSEKYSIYWMHDQLALYLFNQSELLAGQDVAVGGPASGAANAQSVSVHRIALRDWGFNGTVVAGSESSGNQTFQIQVNGFAGVLIPQTVTVRLTGETEFREGWTGMSDLTDGAKVRVVGVLLKDPTSGQTVLLGHYVDNMNN